MIRCGKSSSEEQVQRCGSFLRKISPENILSGSRSNEIMILRPFLHRSISGALAMDGPRGY